jgi:tetratricopeptide (TPR) repeat protein
MNRPVNERLTHTTAQEVCLRSNSRALLAGSIAAIGEHYLIGLKAVNCQTSDTLSSAEAEVADRNHVLKALSDVGTQLREKLGESLASVQKFNQPLEQATTSSLEALQAYTQGQRMLNEQGANASIPYFKHAVDLDPNFAIAYAALGEAYGEYYADSPKIQNLTRAYELRDRVSRRERFNIESVYYSDVTGDVEKGIQTYTEWIQSYPDDSFPHLQLASSFRTLGQYEKSAAEARDAVRLLPAEETYFGLLCSYLAMDRLQDVKAVLRETEKRNLDAFPLRQIRYMTAFIEGDDKSMKEQDTWAMGKPGVEALQYFLQSSNEAYHGRFNAARDLSRLAEESATRVGARDLAALIKTVHSPNEAEIGDKNIARRSVAETLALNPGRSQKLEAPAALTLALLGDLGHARRLLAKMNQEFPLDTMMQSYTLPTIRAVIELSSNNPRKAIEILQIVGPRELAAMDVPPNGLYPAYVRGLSYLNLRQGQQAATEFQKIIDHPGTTLLHLQGALARLHLGRAQVMMGNRIAARKSYQDFLTLWKDADPDIPIYKQAKAEYAKLRR